MDILFGQTEKKIIEALNKKNLKQKLYNYILVETQKLNKEIILEGYPFWLTIDPTNICNLRCPFCPTGQNRNSRTKAILSLDNFKKIIDELGPYLIHIDLCNWGEPLLNNDIFKMVAYAKKFDIDIKIDTNLTMLDENKAEEMVLSGLDKLIVSIDGASPSTYSKYRVGGDFNKVIDNLKILIKTKKRLKKKNPYISWQFLVFRHNEHEIEKVKKLARDIGVEHIGITKAFIGDKDWIPLNPEYSNYDNKKLENNTTEFTYECFVEPNNKFCNWPWEAVVINANGSISVCCSVEDEEDDFGNIFETPFKDIWNNEKYKTARMYIINRDLKNINNNHNICVGCKHLGLINFDILSCHSLFT